jgi:hypothetical protein
MASGAVDKLTAADLLAMTRNDVGAHIAMLTTMMLEINGAKDFRLPWVKSKSPFGD